MPCHACELYEIMNAFMAGGSKKASEPQSEPAAGQTRRMNRHISQSTQLDPEDPNDPNEDDEEDDEEDGASQENTAQADAKKPKPQPKRSAAKTMPRKKPSRHVIKPTGSSGSKSAAAKKHAQKIKTNKEPEKKAQKTQKTKEKEKEEGDKKDRQDKEALKVAEAKSAACKPNHPQKKRDKDDESQSEGETPADVQNALHRADTQDITKKEQVRRAYKTRKERFYRSLRSVHLSCLFSFALHMWSCKMLQVRSFYDKTYIKIWGYYIC